MGNFNDQHAASIGYVNDAVVNAFEKQLKGVKIIKDIKVEEIITENIDDNNNN